MRIVQISDLHLFADKQQELLGVKTFDSFVAVVDLIRADKTPPEMIIVSGDMAQDHLKQAYCNMADILNQFSIPIYFVVGNHDNAMIVDQLFPLKNILSAKNIVFDEWNLILLNSQIPGSVAGNLDTSQMDYMQACLKRYPTHHAMVIFHHQPIPVGSAWIDQYVLQNSDEFWDTVKKYPQLKIILFGHVHQVHEGQKQGVHYYSVPATCIQFMRNKDDFALENLNPGYRWIDLLSEGKFETGVVRIPHYIGRFEATAKGYE